MGSHVKSLMLYRKYRDKVVLCNMNFTYIHMFFYSWDRESPSPGERTQRVCSGIDEHLSKR